MIYAEIVKILVQIFCGCLVGAFKCSSAAFRMTYFSSWICSIILIETGHRSKAT